MPGQEAEYELGLRVTGHGTWMEWRMARLIADPAPMMSSLAKGEGQKKESRHSLIPFAQQESRKLKLLILPRMLYFRPLYPDKTKGPGLEGHVLDWLGGGKILKSSLEFGRHLGSNKNRWVPPRYSHLSPASNAPLPSGWRSTFTGTPEPNPSQSQKNGFRHMPEPMNKVADEEERGVSDPKGWWP
ncbi:hypothetical protein NM208_g11893 [Fusarium decemcellulare]|uniref:Uncharacterized protein n=1 Tax=Fusarium decemcellulare TaxID=57161 RepID=A0ACC1RSL0_9HYPO|nr:hypothetical protein NM208_g11893 [Fusarium decemcellulare]